MRNFKIITHAIVNVPTNENHLVYEYLPSNGKIQFSISRQGNAASIHIACEPDAAHQLRTAFKEWLQFVFESFPWTTMIIGKINDKNPKVARFAKRFGFEKIVEYRGGSAWMLGREEWQNT